MTLNHFLRDVTAGLHEQLDSADREREATATREGYADYLATFQSALDRCWSRVDWERARSLSLPSLELRKARYLALASDLDSLGHATGSLKDESFRESDGGGITAGCLYVLEGSVLGGRKMLAKLEENTGPIGDSASRFFQGFGERTPAFWREFLTWLDGLPGDDEFRNEAAEGAVWCFGQFISSFGCPGKSNEACKLPS